MPFFSEETLSEISAADGSRYINPSKLDAGENLELIFMQDTPVSYWTIFAESASGERPRSFRFLRKPSKAEMLKEMGGDWQPALCPEEWESTKFKGQREELKPEHVVPVYNKKTGLIEILCIKQKSIFDGLKRKSLKEKYADLTEHDIEITKVKPFASPWYEVEINPADDSDHKKAQTAWEKALDDGFDLTRYLDNGDPFFA